MMVPTHRPQCIAQPSMRLYAFLLFVLIADAAQSASIPDDATSTIEKKIEIPHEANDKIPDDRDQEKNDQTNIIDDVDNKLRSKLEENNIVVNNAEQILKTSDDDEEIVRPPVDLRNPGPPQRQEHETQNPEFYASEQDFAETYKKNLNDAQVFLKQGFQGVQDGIQNIFQNNEPINVVQDNIQKLRDGFISQINKLNGTLQNYLHGDNTGSETPTEEHTKANIKVIETGLKTIKEDFSKGVNVLATGFEELSSVKPNNLKQNQNPPVSGPWFANIQQNFQQGFQNITNFFQGLRPPQSLHQVANLQEYNQIHLKNPSGGNQNFMSTLMQNLQNAFNSYSAQVMSLFGAAQHSNSTSVNSTKPEGSETQTDKPNDPVNLNDQGSRVTLPVPVTQVAPINQASSVPQPGPIRQILQNNPITQGIAATVQRLQNINNPEKPRDTEKSVPEIVMAEDQKKGHSPASGDHNDSSGSSGLSESMPSNEVPKEILPAEDMKEQKSEEVVKTE